MTARTQQKFSPEKFRFSLPAAIFLLSAVVAAAADESRHPLVLMSDFGLTDRFVASMKGVAISVDPDLQVYDLTHQIEPFNIWRQIVPLDQGRTPDSQLVRILFVV